MSQADQLKFAVFLSPVPADHSLVRTALTHRSFLVENRIQDEADNQRLEFLGDAVLQWLSTAYLHEKFPNDSEGQLTKRRSHIVSREALCELAVRVGLPAHLCLGRSEERDGGRTRPNIVADATEAVIGALYRELGPEGIHQWACAKLHPFWDERLHTTRPLNPKGELQEILQSLATETPVYHVTDCCGPDHDRTFTVRVMWRGHVLGTGQGKSKKDAETVAALAALQSRLWENSTP